jgi:outer membrane receptor protein involved in Fe transport
MVTSWINGYSSYWAPSKTMSNPDLKWETTITRNIGLDYVMFGGKLNGSFEFYWNNTKDLLLAFPVAGTGYTTQYRNMGETKNTGFEASVTWNAVNKKDWGLSIGANVSFNKNKVVSLGDLDEIDNIATGWASTEIDKDFMIKVGEPIGQIYGYVSDG